MRNDTCLSLEQKSREVINTAKAALPSKVTTLPITFTLFYSILNIMISQVIQTIKTANLSVEIDSSSVFKVRGSFNGCDVVISADHHRQIVSIASRSLRGHKEYSYPAFIHNFA